MAIRINPTVEIKRPYLFLFISSPFFNLRKIKLIVISDKDKDKDKENCVSLFLC